MDVSDYRDDGRKAKVEKLRNKEMRWELEAENRSLSDSEMSAWLETRKQWEISEKEHENMLCQKSRFRWDVEGDENLEIFHAFVKRRNKKCNLRGLMVDGVWCEDPMSYEMLLQDYCKNVSGKGETSGGKCGGEEKNAFIKEVVKKGIFRGVMVGTNKVSVSHLQYADDTIFFEEWNKENAKSLMCILKCFEEVSGLKVNYNKSKLYGIGVNEDEMMDMAKWMGCGTGEFPFTYLGLPIGENMRRVSAWGPAVDKFQNKLADWKAKTMSFGVAFNDRLGFPPF
nr:protein kinase-like domain, beta-lactamase/transpeptidase-like protein [Tanacetum cinerariifolium]